VNVENAARVEYAATPSIAAARSLARHANMDLTAALRHLQNGTARILIETRVAERRANEAHIERIQRMTEWRIRDGYLRARASGCSPS
jgi:hypothetical protein